jgi:pyruvate dehydrogenase E2 component (dihydrolipoamide acetyltransferase)
LKPTMAERITVSVPDLGDFHDVEVIEVSVKAGDTIAVDTPLITLETDKATMDVPSTAAGRVAAVSVKKGDRVSKGSAVVVIESAATPAARKASSRGGDRKPAATAGVAQSAAPAATAELEVRVPDLGDFRDVEVIEVLVKAGDTVALETPLVTLETEKATMDVPSSAAGIVSSLGVDKGSRVNAGDLVAIVRGEAGAAPAAAPAHCDSCRKQAHARKETKGGGAAMAAPAALPGQAHTIKSPTCVKLRASGSACRSRTPHSTTSSTSP